LPIGTTFPEVLAAAQAGAGWAFEVIYRDLAPALTGYLRLQGAAEPDDLASETFIGVFTGLRAFRGDEAGLRAWVFTIGRRRRDVLLLRILADLTVEQVAAVLGRTAPAVKALQRRALTTLRSDLCVARDMAAPL
jgi:RNA polymerase sigma-70 factor (ECF subfamily)